MAIERLVGHFEAVRDPRCGGKIGMRQPLLPITHNLAAPGLLQASCP